MRRVDRMRDQAARAARQLCGEAACHDRGRGRGEHDIGRRDPVELAEDRELGFDRLRHILLDEIGARDGVGQIRRHPHARGGPVRVVEQTIGGKLCKAGLDPGLGTLRLIWNAIAERDVPSGAREHGRPRAPDQPGSDDRHLRHSRPSMSLSCRLDRRYRMCCDSARIALLSFVTE